MAGDALGFIIMRKDDPITYAEFTSDGNMISYSRNIMNKELAPLQDMYQGQWLNLWWKERSIPIEQDNIAQFLRANGYSMPSDFLIKNLGLSLTDYYWIKPIDSDLTWRDVNLFENDFKGNLLNWEREPHGDRHNDMGIPHYSPNSSLQGTIEKSWVINNGERILIKGNHSPRSDESINETIACEIHRRQGWSNYCDYHLIEISNKEYAYGCYSKIFTSQEKELVSAWSLFTNEKKQNTVSNYEHLLKMCGKFGMDIEDVRRDFEYQILVDFIMSGHDRHLNNIAFLRDADTLGFIGMAPIFDSGGSMFAGKTIPKNEKDLLNITTQSFAKKESDLISLVRDKSLIDLSKLPPASFVRDAYRQDPKMEEKDIKNIAYYYERKIDMCRDLQLGRDVFKKIYHVEQQKHALERKDFLSCKMEAAWYKYAALPVEQKGGIEWEGEKIRLAMFDDKYLAQCEIDGRVPDKRISDHFWKKCVETLGYKPRFCSIPDNIRRSTNEQELALDSSSTGQ